MPDDTTLIIKLHDDTIEAIGQEVARSLAGLLNQPVTAATKLPMPQPRLLSTKEAAALLGVSSKALRELRSRVPGDLPGGPVKKTAGQVRPTYGWPEESVLDWLQAAQDHLSPARPRKGRKRRARGSKVDDEVYSSEPVDWGT